MNLPETKKSLGQHWLTDLASLEAMVDAAQLKPGESVLEIGPGTGTLTDVLLAHGVKVTALEFDHERVPELASKYKSNTNVTVQQGDIRKFDLSTMPISYKIVANIPYYLTANLLRKLIEDTHKPVITSLLVQKEVAQRVTAEPGQLSQLAVLTQIFYQTALGEIVPAYLFTPPPKVDSQILILKLRKTPLIEPSRKLFDVIKAGFSEKRKKLRSSLGGGLSIDKAEAEKLLISAKIDPNKRAQELEVSEWFRLAQIINT